MPGPTVLPRARPQAWSTPEPQGTGRLGLAVGGKKAVPGPGGAGFCGAKLLPPAHGEGRNGTARPGSQGWGDVGQGRSRG